MPVIADRVAVLIVPAGGEQVDPSVQVVPLTVVAGFASAELGMADAVTDRVGVVVLVATAGVSQDGQVPAMKFVTDPPPDPEPVNVQVVPVQLPAPALKLNVKAPAVLLIDVTPAATE